MPEPLCCDCLWESRAQGAELQGQRGEQEGELLGQQLGDSIHIPSVIPSPSFHLPWLWQFAARWAVLRAGRALGAAPEWWETAPAGPRGCQRLGR